jgi:glucose-1-phosphate thymidylyltransferase
MKQRKGIVLAGGRGLRLNPITSVISKQLLQIYDKPMIYYPISTLMLANVRDILIISTPEHLPLIKDLISKVGNIGVNFEYKVQENPNGIAESFILAENFLADSPCVLILGDNLFYGNGFSALLQQAGEISNGAHIFSYKVKNPNQYGVLKFKNNEIVSIEEKPTKFVSNLAITGLYFYDNNVVKFAKDLKPSQRGELEITDINLKYIKKGLLKVTNLPRGFAWLDTGTTEGLLDSANFIATIERRQGIKIACLEEIAWQKKWITTEDLKELPSTKLNSEYGEYLKNLVES